METGGVARNWNIPDCSGFVPVEKFNWGIENVPGLVDKPDRFAPKDFDRPNEGGVVVDGFPVGGVGPVEGPLVLPRNMGGFEVVNGVIFEAGGLVRPVIILDAGAVVGSAAGGGAAVDGTVDGRTVGGGTVFVS